MRSFFLYTCVFILLAGPAWADRVILKNGEALEGDIISENEASITIKTTDGAERTLFRFQFDSVEKESDSVIEAITPDSPPPELPAADDVQAEELTSFEKDILVKQIVEKTGIRFQIERVIQRMLDRSPQQAHDQIRAMFNVDDILEAVAPVYTRYYTIEELQELLDFYNSPLGQKFTEVGPQISSEAMKATLEHFQNIIKGEP
jgi:hypothetical protein